MELINVNPSECIKCGLCSYVCPSNVLSLEETGPKVINQNNCIACGHCVAVCPYGAIDNIKTPASNQVDMEAFPVIDSKTAEYFLRSRRSIRCYKEVSIPKEELLKLVNIAHYAPTASNTQGISFIIVENKEILKKATEVIIGWMEQHLESHYSFPRHVQAYRDTRKDTILRDAPHLILTTSSKDLSTGRNNAISALSYAELYANTIGLGTCWAGLFEFCAFSNYPPLLELFKIPKDKVITGAIMVGYPKYKYKKLVDRNSLDVELL